MGNRGGSPLFHAAEPREAFTPPDGHDGLLEALWRTPPPSFSSSLFLFLSFPLFLSFLLRHWHVPFSMPEPSRFPTGTVRHAPYRAVWPGTAFLGFVVSFFYQIIICFRRMCFY